MSTSPRTLPYTLLAFAVLVLIVGPIGTAAFVLGFGYGESPCVLCWAQRTGMILVALCGLFVLRFGPRPRYLGLSRADRRRGIFMGLRHSALHLARDVGQGFSAEILGAHTYTWSMFIYWVLRRGDGRAADAAARRRGHRGAAEPRRARARRDAAVPPRGRRQRRAGVRQHRSAAVHGPERPDPLLVQPRALGVVHSRNGRPRRSRCADAGPSRSPTLAGLDADPVSRTARGVCPSFAVDASGSLCPRRSRAP